MLAPLIGSLVKSFIYKKEEVGQKLVLGVLQILILPSGMKKLFMELYGQDLLFGICP
jgi:hypothetical protein